MQLEHLTLNKKDTLTSALSPKSLLLVWVIEWLWWIQRLKRLLDCLKSAQAKAH